MNVGSVGGGREARQRWARRWWPALACFFVYALLASTEFGFDALGSGRMSGGGSMDAIEQTWWLQWAAYGASHGHNLLFTRWQNYPAGQNFGVNGSMLALGLAFAPLTKAFGPIVTWNVAIRLAVALSATSMCCVLRRWTTWWPAAFVGGLLYGFSAYAHYWGNGGGYLFLLFVPLPPVIFLVLDETVVRQRWRPVRTGLLLGLLLVVQFFISTEVFASTIVIGLAMVALLALTDWRRFVRGFHHALVAGASCLGLAAVLLGVPAAYALVGPQHINGTPASPAALSLLPGDLLAPIVPNGELLSPSHLLVTASSFQFAGAMYVGIPLVVALVLFALLFRARCSVLFAAAMTAFALVLSLGPRLYVGGHPTGVPLPFALFEHLPLLQGFLATRFSLYTSLFGAATFAIGLDELWRRLGQRLGRGDLLVRASGRGRPVAALAVVGAVVIAVLVPLVPNRVHRVASTTAPNVPSFFTSAAVDRIPPGSVVLAYPYPDAESTGWASIFFPPGQSILLDQAVAGMRFKVVGGYGWFPSPSGRFGTTAPALLTPPSVRALFDAALLGRTASQTAAPPSTTCPVAGLRAFLRRYGIGTVIVTHLGRSAAVVSQVTLAIGPPVSSGGVTVWFDVAQRLRAPAGRARSPVRHGPDCPGNRPVDPLHSGP